MTDGTKAAKTRQRKPKVPVGILKSPEWETNFPHPSFSKESTKLQPLGARHHLEVPLEPLAHLRAVDHGAVLGVIENSARRRARVQPQSQNALTASHNRNRMIISKSV